MNLILFFMQSLANELVLKLIYAAITLMLAYWTFRHSVFWGVIALRIIAMVILISIGMPILFVLIANFILCLIENFLNFKNILDYNSTSDFSFSENYKFLFFLDYHWVYVILLILEIVGAILFYRKGF